MTADATSRTDWNERLERLERRNHRLTGLVVLLVLIALAQTAWQFMPPPAFIAARSFRLQDAKGPARAELVLWKDGTPMFRINNAYGQPRGLWSLRGDGTMSLRMTDERFLTRAELLVEAQGSPRLRLTSADGRRQAQLDMANDGRAHLIGVAP